MNLLLLESDEIDAAGRAQLQDRRAKHIRSVLRAVPDQILRVGVVGGGIGQARVVSLDNEMVELAIELGDRAPAASWIDLIVGVPRPAVLHRVLQTVAAMDVGRLDLTAAWRVEKSFFSSPVLRPESIRKHLLLGAEQGMTTRLPIVRQHRLLMPFVRELETAADPPQRVLAHPDASEPFESILSLSAGNRLEIAIGPEGGWIDREVESFERAGFVACSLGPWILRVETAVTAALAQAELLRRMSAGEPSTGPC